MNHTDFINRFWRLDEECRFSAVETRLFLMLIDMFARIGTERSVTWTNNLATGLLGVSLNAFRKACAALEQRGLIVVESGIVKRRRYTTISLAATMVTPVEPPQSEEESVVEPLPDIESDYAPCDIVEPELAPKVDAAPEIDAKHEIEPATDERSEPAATATGTTDEIASATAPVRRPKRKSTANFHHTPRLPQRRPSRTIPLSALSRKKQRP